MAACAVKISQSVLKPNVSLDRRDCSAIVNVVHFTEQSCAMIQDDILAVDHCFGTLRTIDGGDAFAFFLGQLLVALGVFPLLSILLFV